jgi:hypothetical protein
MKYLGWYEEDTKLTLPEKLEEGSRHYHQKFEEEPDVVLVSPTEVPEQMVLKVNGYELTVRPVDYVRPNHYWIGREGKEKTLPASTIDSKPLSATQVVGYSTPPKRAAKSTTEAPKATPTATLEPNKPRRRGVSPTDQPRRGRPPGSKNKPKSQTTNSQTTKATRTNGSQKVTTGAGTSRTGRNRRS